MATAPEDILSSALQSLYSYTPVAFSSPSAPFTHRPSGLTLASPDPAAANWHLHASSVWVASLYLANHLDQVASQAFSARSSGGDGDDDNSISVLELGAAAGLPGILFAKRHRAATVTLSDYPDDNILHTLRANVAANGVPPAAVRVVGHAWGESVADLLDGAPGGPFDLVLAADTLWNSETHLPLCTTLSRVLKRSTPARAFLVAGLHTGRWVVHHFLHTLPRFGLSVDRIEERSALVDGDLAIGQDAGPLHREWAVERHGESESERSRWVVWIVVKWANVQP